MADVKISGLPAVGALTATDVLPLAQGPETKKVSLAQLDGRWVSASSGGSINGGLTVNPYLAVGTNPAQTGVLRIPNNQFMYARNAANNADLPFLIVTSGNVTQVNASASVQITLNGSAVGTFTGALASHTTPLAIGANPAASGIVRIPNSQWITARNDANTGDQNMWAVASNALLAGSYVNMNGQSLYNALNLSVGTNPATTGAVRLPNNQGVSARNGANSADLNLITVSASDQVFVGAMNVGTLSILASSSMRVSINGLEQLGIYDRIWTIADGVEIRPGVTNGLKIGSAATQKLGFYGATPVVRPTLPAAATDPATTMALVNAIRTNLIALGLMQ